MSAVRPLEPMLTPLEIGLDTANTVFQARADLLLTVALLRTAGEVEKAAALAGQVSHLTAIAAETLTQLCALTTPEHPRLRQLSSLILL